MTTDANHPARATAALADAVSTIDDTLAPDRRITPAIASRVALDACCAGYAAGRRDAIRELRTTEDAATDLGITARTVRQTAANNGIGWQISRGVWLFDAASMDRLRARVGQRGRPRSV